MEPMSSPLPGPLPTNDAIEWTGQRYGLKPYLDQPAGLETASADEVAALAPTLIEALGDPDRFVVAHVLLTRLSRVSHETFPGWNGLAVELAVDGSSRVDPAPARGTGPTVAGVARHRPAPVRAARRSRERHPVERCPVAPVEELPHPPLGTVTRRRGGARCRALRA